MNMGRTAQKFDGGSENCARAHAVRVIISMDDDTLSLNNRLQNSQRRLFHIAEKKRVMDIPRVIGIQKNSRRVGRTDSAPKQHTSDQKRRMNVSLRFRVLIFWQLPCRSHTDRSQPKRFFTSSNAFIRKREARTRRKFLIFTKLT